MVVVHDRVPGEYSLNLYWIILDMKTYPPLPDFFLDNIPLIPWAFECCEFIGMAMFLCFLTIILFHKYRYIFFWWDFTLTLFKVNLKDCTIGKSWSSSSRIYMILPPPPRNQTTKVVKSKKSKGRIFCFPKPVSVVPSLRKTVLALIYSSLYTQSLSLKA